MFSNGSLARCEEVPPDGILVIEPELPEGEDFPAVIDQTQAVKEAENASKKPMPKPSKAPAKPAKPAKPMGYAKGGMVKGKC